MSSSDFPSTAGIYKLMAVEPSGSRASVSPVSEDVLANSLLIVEIVGQQYVIMRPEELRALGSEHRVICYADRASGSLNKQNGERIKNLPKGRIEEFLEGMITALNLVQPVKAKDSKATSDSHSGSDSAVSEGEERPVEISESRDHLTNDQVQDAIRKALKLVSRGMDKNIDRWVVEAGDRLMHSATLKGISDAQRMKSVASQLQGTSGELSKRFQARLIECLHKFNHPEKEQIDLSNHNLSLAEDGHWHKHTAILSLSSKVAGQTKLDFNQLNRRFSYLLNRRIKPEKNVIGPEMMAWSLCSAVGDVSYSREQVDALSEVISEFFAGTMGKIYRDVNLLWIGMDIIPQIKLRVWQDDYQPRNRY